MNKILRKDSYIIFLRYLPPALLVMTLLAELSALLVDDSAGRIIRELW
jgi:hypothetical protein